MSKPLESRKNLLIQICLENYQLAKENGYFVFDREGNFQARSPEETQSSFEEVKQFYQTKSEELKKYSEEEILRITAKFAYGRLAYLGPAPFTKSPNYNEAKEILVLMNTRLQQNEITNTAEIATKYREICLRTFDYLEPQKSSYNLNKDCREIAQDLSESELMSFFDNPKSSPTTPKATNKRPRQEVKNASSK